jgi:hypothetical protein
MMMKMTWTIGMTYAFSRYIIIVVVIYYKIAKMKTITIKRRRRMTKHRKGMTKPRKSNRRIKNRKHKTRRQSGGWGWKSFIQAGDNQLKIVFDNNPLLLLHMVAGKNKGIDVKFKRESSGNCVWLIGNTDKTFKELRDGAKDGRYQTFINVLLEKYPYFNRFETLKEDRDSSKGIILTDKLFCEMFINEPFVLDYPRLREKFNSSGFKCTSSGPSSASAAGTGAAPAPRGPSAAPAPPPSAAGTSAAFRARGPSSAAPSAASIPSSYAKAIDSGVSAAGTVRGGPSAALSAAPPHGPSAAFGPPLPSEQTIQRLMNGIFTRADVMLALNKTNNNIEAAVDVLNTAASQSPFATPPCNEYIEFEHQISYKMEQPDKILQKKYNISVDDNTSLGIALKWADASYQCNLFYDASFKEYVTGLNKQNYEYLVTKSLEMTVNPKQLPFKTQEINDDGWCFYRAVLTAAQRNPGDVRKFAQAITYCVTHIFTNTEDVMKQPLNTRVNGIPSQITAAQLVKLISIPNLTEKNHPCVYPELDQCIGQAAAYILQKNIFIYDERGSVIGKYCGTDSTDPKNQIYLVNTNRNHFDIITAAH